MGHGRPTDVAAFAGMTMVAISFGAAAVALLLVGYAVPPPASTVLHILAAPCGVLSLLGAWRASRA